MADTPNRTVFVAQVSEPMQKYRENLVKELEHSGCTVMHATPSEISTEEVREILNGCDAAVHILSNQDFQPNASGKGMEELQVNYSVQNFLNHKVLSDPTQNGFKIYAWHLKSNSENIFVEEQLPRHITKVQQLEEVEFLRTNFEQFKYYLLNHIGQEVGSEQQSDFYIRGNDETNIYFIHDAVDIKPAKKYIDELKKRGYSVLVPDFGEDIIATRKQHLDALKTFDIAIIYSAESSENWATMKVMDVLKSPGMGRQRTLLAKALIMAEEDAQKLPAMVKDFEFISTQNGDAKSHIDDLFLRLQI